MKKVLVAVTNHDHFDKIQRATGLWLSEAVDFQAVMERNGVHVDYVSPDGGWVPIDAASLAPDSMNEACWRYYGDPAYCHHYLRDSLAADDVDPSQYEAIYFAGGHGVLWDFPTSTALASIAEAIWAAGGVVSSTCHGCAGLLGMRASDGAPFVAGKHLTGFSNEEEQACGLADAVPFSTQDALQEQGAGYQAAKPFSVHVIRDGNLVTGQNPQSAATVAKKVLNLVK